MMKLLKWGGTGKANNPHHPTSCAGAETISCAACCILPVRQGKDKPSHRTAGCSW